jgi:hypothetical protein
MFLGERNVAPQHSGLASVYYDNHNNNDRNDRPPNAIGPNGQLTPPDDFPIADETMMGRRRGLGAGANGSVRGWLEIWDYAGGSSFRGFVAEDVSQETKSLFVFFDVHSISRDLKQAYVPLFSWLKYGSVADLVTDSLLSLSWPKVPLPARTWSSASSGRYLQRKQKH